MRSQSSVNCTSFKHAHHFENIKHHVISNKTVTVTNLIYNFKRTLIQVSTF